MTDDNTETTVPDVKPKDEAKIASTDTDGARNHSVKQMMPDTNAEGMRTLSLPMRSPRIPPLSIRQPQLLQGISVRTLSCQVYCWRS